MFRKNVAGQYLSFALINTSNGAGLTGATVTAYRALDNGSQTAITGTVTELGNGHYRLNLSQADTNADEGSFFITAPNASPVEKTVVFTAADPSNAASFGLSNLNAQVGSIPTNPLLTTDTRLNNLDATISSRATQTSVNSIPTNPLLTTDTRLNNLDATVSSRSTQTSVSLIPTNPLLTNDSRLNYLNASIAAIPTNPLLTNDTRLNFLDASISTTSNSILSAISGLNNLSAKCNLFGASLLEAPDTGSTVYEFTLVVKDDEDKLVNLDASPTVTATNASGTNRSSNLSAVTNPSTGRYRFTYTVSSSHSRESLRIEASGTISSEARYAIWAGAVVDYDQSTVLAQISAGVSAIPTNPVLVTDSRLNNLDATVSSRATQTSVNSIPVNPLLTNDSRLNYLNASILAIPTNPLLTTDTRLNNLDATISSRATQTSVNNLPSAASITTAVYSAMPSAGWPNGSFGDRILISNNSNRTVGVTGSGSGHVQCVVHEMQPGVIVPGVIVTDAISDSAISAAAVTKIQNGLATATALSNVATDVATLVSRITSQAAQLFVDLATMLTGSGTALVKWTVNALSLAPSGGGGQTIIATVAVPQILENTAYALNEVVVYRGTQWSFQVQNLGDLSPYQQIYFSLRKRQNDTEAQSDVLISLTQGLIIGNKQIGKPSNLGSLTVSGQNITIQVDASITQFIDIGNNYNYDLKGINAANQVIMLHESDKFVVKKDVTRRIS